jgi:hypothetical protein
MISTERGSTKRVKVTLYNENDELVDADTDTCKIAIWFQDGTVVLASTTMTHGTTGIYTYRWTPASTINIGTYHIEITATFGTQYHVNRDSIYLTDIISSD